MLHSATENLFVLRSKKKLVLIISDNLEGIISVYHKEPMTKKTPKGLEVIQFRAQSFQKKVSMKRLLKMWNKLGDKPIDLNEI